MHDLIAQSLVRTGEYAFPATQAGNPIVFPVRIHSYGVTRTDFSAGTTEVALLRQMLRHGHAVNHSLCAFGHPAHPQVFYRPAEPGLHMSFDMGHNYKVSAFIHLLRHLKAMATFNHLHPLHPDNHSTAHIILPKAMPVSHPLISVPCRPGATVRHGGIKQKGFRTYILQPVYC